MEPMPSSFVDKYGPWALVTGASQGIGFEFARKVAARGVNVVLVARTASVLQDRAERLRHIYGVETRAVPLDLADDFLLAIEVATRDLDVGLLVNNAGISTVGPFLDRSVDYLTRQLEVNNRAGVILARHFGEQMVGRGHGGVIFLSSGSALHGTPWSAAYAGTKAFNLILAEALWYEWQPLGVDVLGFMAGLTRTPGLDANSPRTNRIVPLMDARPAVAEALDALGRRPCVAAGRLNRLGYGLMGLMPRSMAIRLIGRQMESTFGIM